MKFKIEILFKKMNVKPFELIKHIVIEFRDGKKKTRLSKYSQGLSTTGMGMGTDLIPTRMGGRGPIY